MKLCECGKCGLEVTHESNKYLMGHYIRTKEMNLLKSESLKGRKLTEEHKLNIAKNHKGMIGKHHSEETRLKLSKFNKGKPGPMVGKKLSLESRLKMSISAVKRIERQSFNGEIMIPGIGKNENYIIDILFNNTGINFLKNSKNLFLKCGKWLDGYSPKYNIDLEIDESYHYIAGGDLRKVDIERDLLVASRLGCVIYRIKDQEFIKNQEKEIQRFKDFINVLEEEVIL